MRIRNILFVVVIAGLSLFVCNAYAQGVPRTVNEAVNEMWAILLDKQMLYQATHGHFFQGLITHSTIPANGSGSFPDLLTTRPTDQAADWVEFLDPDLPGNMTFAIVSDSYVSDRGSGFVATFYVQVGANTHYKAMGIGPEGSSRSHAWQIYEEPTIP